MTTETDLIFDALYEEVEPRLHQVLDEEIQIIMDDMNLSADMAKRLIDAFYLNEIKREETSNAKKKAS